MIESPPLLQYNAANGHLVREKDVAFLLHVPTTALFGMDDLGTHLIEMCRAEAYHEDDLVTRLSPHYAPQRVRDLIGELRKLEVLQPKNALRAINPAAAKLQNTPLSTVVLNVNTGCNLHCTYCYKEDLAVPREGKRMDFVTAARSIDLLFSAGEKREKLNVVFFGGEPLTNLSLIRDVVSYAEALGQIGRAHV